MTDYHLLSASLSCRSVLPLLTSYNKLGWSIMTNAAREAILANFFKKVHGGFLSAQTPVRNPHLEGNSQ